ncbi:MAG TPA: ATP-grasp domain-containing protein [Phycisphaerae bacterium]|nr:ATP-grasp domain-containing protein [Phycisphaerae bacterium]
MRLYENEAKAVFEREGIAVPRALGVFERAADIRGSVGADAPVMLKALVLIGGRGKAGGVRRAAGRAEAVSFATEMLGREIRGYPVERLLIEEAVEAIGGAAYVGVTMNPADFNVTVIVSPAGGVDIEQVARETPEKILKVELPGNDDVLPEAEAVRLTAFLVSGLPGGTAQADALKAVVSRIYAVFQKYDCKVAEINPLLLTAAGPVAADAKIVLDDNGLYRQEGLFQLLGLATARHDVSEPTRNEVRARAAGFRYVDLLAEDHKKDPEKLYVGLVPGGAGYGIFSIDEVANVGDRFFGGRVIPVNFMDSGGGPTVAQVAEMFDLLFDDEVVDLVITSRFGGISSCDVFIRGLVGCLRERRKTGRRVVPVVGRMVGTDLPSARDFMERAKRETPGELADMLITVGNQKIMADVIREGIRFAFDRKGWA